MMEIVKARSGIARNKVHWVEKGNIIATVNVNGFHETEGHPGPHHNHVVAQQQDANEETET